MCLKKILPGIIVCEEFFWFSESFKDIWTSLQQLKGILLPHGHLFSWAAFIETTRIFFPHLWKSKLKPIAGSKYNRINNIVVTFFNSDYFRKSKVG